MQVIPAVDVLDGLVVRLMNGRYDEATTYGSDPVEVGTAWMADGAELIHVVDLNGARSGEPDSDLWKALGESGVVFQIGGGIRDQTTAEKAVQAGAARVVVGTATVHGGRALHKIAAAVGHTRVVAAIDVRSDRARGAGWTDEGAPVRDVVHGVVGSGVGVAIVTGIERDGAMSGPDIKLLAQVSDLAPSLRIIASGGVDSLAAIADLRSLECEAAIIGRALYEGSFTLPDAIAAASDNTP
jgi:phosphoribosylformimino-5-aminoimidazole carboxamide ribotide isomerase